MEWATAQGADIVNMSLGGDATDGNDPLSQLVNQLSAETGALFVTSAGNTRRPLRVVGAPAAADAALAVGAVDKSDQRASFSSQGPIADLDGRARPDRGDLTAACDLRRGGPTHPPPATGSNT